MRQKTKKKIFPHQKLKSKNLLELEKNIFEPKKCYDYDDIEYN